MKTEDERDERIGELLDEAAQQLRPEKDVDPVLRRGARRRAARFSASVLTAAVFVAAVGWAGLAIRGNRTSTARRTFGDLSSSTWTIRYPSDWHRQDLPRCGTSLPGAIFTNTTFTFRNPKGGLPSCGDRLVFAGFPQDGVAVAVQPEGGWLGLGTSLDTPFPIRMGQLVNTSGTVGGHRDRYLGITIRHDEAILLSTYVGQTSTTASRSEVAQAVGSLRVRGETRWTTSVIAKTKGIAVSVPNDWHVAIRDDAGILITSYPPGPSSRARRAPGPDATGGLGPADVMIWIPPPGSSINEPTAPTSPPVGGSLHPFAMCSGGAAAGWRYYTVVVGAPGTPRAVKIEVVYGALALRGETAGILGVVLNSLHFGRGRTSVPDPTVVAPLPRNTPPGP